MKKSYISRKDSIILSAIEIIDDLGIDALSIRELAKRQGVTEPALYRHFKNKQDIVLGVLDYFSKFDAMIAKAILERKLPAKEGILFFTQSYCEYYENYPALTALLFAYDSLRYDAAIAEKLINILEFRSNVIAALAEEGQKKGELSTVYTPEEFADIITGTVRVMILKWRIRRYSFPLKARILGTVEKFLKLC